jgi:hydroxyacylglutathione hydrolase
MLSIHRIVNSPVSSNCYVLYNKVVGDYCIIVDPGSKEGVVLFDFIDSERLTPKYVILTHEHFDHCWGVNDLVKRYQIPIVCSALCSDNIKSYKKNCSVFYDPNIRFTIESETVSIESVNNQLSFSQSVIVFFNSPGHSDASICFYVDKYLFTGDTLIKDLRTVTKLKTGSEERLQESLKAFGKFIGEKYVVCAGHGDCFVLDGYPLEKAL